MVCDISEMCRENKKQTHKMSIWTAYLRNELVEEQWQKQIFSTKLEATTWTRREAVKHYSWGTSREHSINKRAHMIKVQHTKMKLSIWCMLRKCVIKHVYPSNHREKGNGRLWRVIKQKTVSQPTQKNLSLRTTCFNLL